MLRKLKGASQRLQQMETPAHLHGILARLQAGQRWLTEQRRLWLADDPQAVSDERFSEALAAWDALERVFRCSGYIGCIWGPSRSCPDDAPVWCDGCVVE